MQDAVKSEEVADQDFRFSLAGVLRGLADVQLRTIVTTRMAPAIYVFCSAAVAAINLYVAVQAFEQGMGLGLVWVFLIMPVTFIAGVIVVRVVLEVVLSIFRIVVNMETLMEQLHTLRGQTESIAEKVDDLPLPRIQFWRSRKPAAPVDSGSKNQEPGPEGEHGTAKK